MHRLGPLAKFLALATGGKQPEDQLHPRGFLGLELAEAEGEVRVADVLADSPAAKGGVRQGDRLVRVLDHPVTSLQTAREAVAAVRPDDRVTLVVRRGAGTEDLTVTAGEGL
jgi:S1-C subfamily serine protease